MGRVVGNVRRSKVIFLLVLVSCVFMASMVLGLAANSISAHSGNGHEQSGLDQVVDRGEEIVSSSIVEIGKSLLSNSEFQWCLDNINEIRRSWGASEITSKPRFFYIEYSGAYFHKGRLTGYSIFGGVFDENWNLIASISATLDPETLEVKWTKVYPPIIFGPAIIIPKGVDPKTANAIIQERIQEVLNEVHSHIIEKVMTKTGYFIIPSGEYIPPRGG